MRNNNKTDYEERPPAKMIVLTFYIGFCTETQKHCSLSTINTDDDGNCLKPL